MFRMVYRLPPFISSHEILWEQTGQIWLQTVLLLCKNFSEMETPKKAYPAGEKMNLQ